MYRMIMVHRIVTYNSRSYKIRVTKTGSAITRIKEHIKPTIISVEDFL